MNNSIFNDIYNVFRDKKYLLQIIIINAVVFVLLNIILSLTPHDIENEIVRFFGLSADISSYYWQVWSLVTYMFTHVGLSHLFFNMFLLYFIGKVFADLYGEKRLLEGYIYGGVLGGILYVISSMIIPTVSPESYLIGASAGVMSIIVATGFLQPNYTVHLFTFKIPMKYIVLVAFITSSVLYIDKNTGGKIAHYGGAIYGYALAYYLPRGLDLNGKISSYLKRFVKLFTSKPKIKVVHKNQSHTRQKTDAKSQAEVDKILDKISKYGYDNLTKEEKDYLFKFSTK